MNGIHDLGGMHGFGVVEPQQHEPVFHAEWERRVLAMARAMGAAGYWNIDEFRRSIEQMPPAEYLAATYYERWLYALESLLLEKDVVSPDEITATLNRMGRIGDTTYLAQRASGVPRPRRGGSASAVVGQLEFLSCHPRAWLPREGSRIPGFLARQTKQTRGNDRRVRPKLTHYPSAHRLADEPRGSSSSPRFEARFKPGDVVVARNINPLGHTRLPRYARGRRGIVRRDWGVFPFPDTRAHGLGANPQHCYSVEFSARELWGDGHHSVARVYLDLWEDYLADERADLSPGRD